MSGMFEVGEATSGGTTTKVFTNTPPSLRAVWELSAAHGDAPYLVYEEDRWTFAEAHVAVARLARRLAGELGVAKGDRVAIAMRNYPEWAITLWAATSVGAVVVPLNAWWTGPELAYALGHASVKVLVADRERLERLAPHLAGTPVATVVGVRTGDAAVPAGTIPWADVVADDGGDGTGLPPVELGPDDDATIMYTSGTTGRPKGAVGTHRNVTAHLMNALYSATQGAAAASTAGDGNGDATGDGDQAPAPPPTATLLTFPLFHVGGFHSFLLPYTAAGGKVVLMYRWDARTALDLVEREGITALGGVPTTLFELFDEARRQDRPGALATLTGVASGATLVPPALVHRIDEQLASKAAPGNGYGLTETSGAAIVNGGADYLARPDSVGRPISPVMEVRIADPLGNPLPPGEVGEIWIKGPTVIRGYLDDPEATAAAITDGWFHTGDAGRLDEDGFLHVADRLKDVVIRGGENVYAAEVEAALYEHPDVTEAAIIGVPHERLGEDVHAVVRLRDGATADAAALRAHVAERLAAFKVPAVVHLTGETLPRNAAGKVLKRELRERLTTVASE
ncbi:MAG TPA: AMP-binding protein [Acidimicrobiales bacterium]